MYLSTVPPYRMTSSPSRSSARSTRDFTASGSIRSANAVYPDRSANSTVTWRRSSGGMDDTAAIGRGGGEAGPDAASSEEPQFMQKRASAGAGVPQFGQRRSSALPQF